MRFYDRHGQLAGHRKQAIRSDLRQALVGLASLGTGCLARHDRARAFLSKTDSRTAASAITCIRCRHIGDLLRGERHRRDDAGARRRQPLRFHCRRGRHHAQPLHEHAQARDFSRCARAKS